jgi:hypothetical protein
MGGRQRQGEVSREQIPGAAWQHAKRNPRACDAAHAGGNDPIAPVVRLTLS